MKMNRVNCSNKSYKSYGIFESGRIIIPNSNKTAKASNSQGKEKDFTLLDNNHLVDSVHTTNEIIVEIEDKDINNEIEETFDDFETEIFPEGTSEEVDVDPMYALEVIYSGYIDKDA